MIQFILFLLVSVNAFAFEAILTVKGDAKKADAEMTQLLKNPKVVSSRSLFSDAEKRIIQKLKADTLAKSLVITLDSQSSYADLANKLKKQKAAIRLEPNQIDIKLAAEPLEDLQWAYNNRGEWQQTELDLRNTHYVPGIPGHDLKLPAGFGDDRNGKKITVAVLDTGVDVNHPDLKSIISRKESECKALEKFRACLKETKKPDGKEMSKEELGNQRIACEKIWFDPNNPEVDQDKNGYPLDCNGWSLLGGLSKVSNILGNPDYNDDEGHGTHVSGIIAALKNNGFGIRGVSNNIEILPVQVVGIAPGQPINLQSVATPGAELAPAPPGTTGNDPLERNERKANRRRPIGLAELVARGLIYAIHNNAKVINFSMGWPAASDSELMRAVFAEAQKRGIIIVASAGNDSTQALLQPCSYPGVICVAAHGPDGALSHFSNYGTGVDIAAPGVNILSTYPLAKRPLGFRAQRGFEFMSGTSQAAPYVTGIVAELLSQGMDFDEIYARIIMGSRPLMPALAIQTLSPHEFSSANKNITELRQDQDRNYILAGQVDIIGALNVEKSPLIVPSGKDRVAIYWDRRSNKFEFPFYLKNFWQTAPANTQITAKIAPSAPGSIRTNLIELKPSKVGAWEKGEVRKYNAVVGINDNSDPSLSRIPSEIDLEVSVEIPGQKTRSFLARAEIIVPITEESFPADASIIPFPELPQAGSPQESTYLKLVDDQLDDLQGYNDFIYFHYKEDEMLLSLVAQDRNLPAKNSPYSLLSKIKLPKPAKEEITQEFIRARIDLDNDGKSEYVVGLLEDNRNETKAMPSPITFHYLSNDFKLIHTQTYDSKMAQFPFQIDGSQVQWMQNKERKVPAWVGMGRDPYKKKTAKDYWENPKQYEDKEFRFYFLDEKGNLQALEKYKAEGDQEFRIANVLRPNLMQVKAGKIPLLLTRDTGTKLKPSYVYEFALAEAYEGKITNFRKVDFFQQGIPYRSLITTRLDSLRSLEYQGEQYLGTYWFGSGRFGEQRLSVLRNDNFQFFDRSYASVRGKADSALFIRSVFANKAGISAIVLTNSELQFHDAFGNTAYRSLERYTFFEDSYTSANQYPLVVADRLLWNQSKLPAVYLTEISALSANRSVRITVPHYEGDKLIELTNPARLRFRSGSDCRPLNSPVWAGANEPIYLDFQCKTKLVRIPLVY